MPYTLPAVFLLFLALNSAASAQTDPFGLDQRIPNTDFLLTTGGETLDPMQLVPAFPRLRFSRPVFLTHCNDGSDRIFVVEQGGVIKVFSNDPDTEDTEVFLDITTKVNSGPNEAGLLSMAFHPSYAENGLFYVYYNTGSLLTRIAEFRVSANPDKADTASERVVLEEDQPAGNHNGGQIGFGPDGYLYIGLGDGGGGGDPWRTGQDLTSLLATILRIDIDRRDPGKGYAVPEDNPFVGNQQNWHEEIWAWGLRNPWRFSFDRLNGDLWTGDVGQVSWEEVDLIEKGKNYGWNIMEGFDCFERDDCNPDDFALPVIQYDREAGRSITGGYVYRGRRLIELYGIYIYADFVSRRVWGLRYENGKVIENQLLARASGGVSSFGEDEAGEVYLLAFDGRVYRFEPADLDTPPGNIPRTIAASGLFVDPQSQSPAPGLIPYQVNAELWSDGAFKTRILALPGTSQIAFAADGPWDFPANTVAVKNFYLDMEVGNPASRRIVETRLLVKRSRGPLWDGFSYMWNEAGTDATLLEDSATKTFEIADPEAPGGIRSQEYYFPSRQDCNACHTAAAGYVLGINTAQLNRQQTYGTIADNQLRSFNHIGLFNQDIGGSLAALPRLPAPNDTAAQLGERARAYLDANCSQCHRPPGSGRTRLDLRFGTPLAATNALDVRSELEDLGLDDPLLIDPGNPEGSLLYLRLLALDRQRMPPLASSEVDRQGAELVRSWIEGLGPTTAVEGQDIFPSSFSLAQNAPNPFNNSTQISFELKTEARVFLAVYDLAGQKVATLLNDQRQPGPHSLLWDGRNEGGRLLASGVYFYQLQVDGASARRKLVLLR